MLKFVKVLLISLLISGCVNNANPRPLVEFPVAIKMSAPMGKSIHSPVTSDAVTLNPITFEYLPDTVNSAAVKMVVHGLKDKKVEDKINADIQKSYDRLLSYTTVSNLPYRGIIARIPEKYFATPVITFTPTFNFNNLLSIVAMATYDFYPSKKQPQRFQIHVSIVDTLNYDLTSGRQLTISDLFTNDADVGNLLNPKVAAVILKTSSEYMDPDKQVYEYEFKFLEQVSPFKGIQGNQVFALSESGLQLFLDYRTPEFDTNASAFRFEIPYADIRDYFAGDKRYKTESSLYLEPIASYRFLYESDYAHHLSENKTLLIDGKTWNTYLNYPKKLNVFYMNRIQTIQDEIPGWVASQKADDILFIKSTIYANMLGRYTLLDMHTSIGGSTWSTSLHQQEVYDESMKRLTLKDVFTDGFDFESLVRPEILWQIAYLDPSLRLTEVIAEYLSNMNFGLNELGLVINTYATSPTDKKTYAIHIYFEYAKIKSKNLTIFK